MRGGDRVTSQNQEEQYEALEKYAINMIEAVKSGKQDPIIGRDEEIRDVVRILSRKTKNNPVLIESLVSVKPRSLKDLLRELSKRCS